MTRSTRMSQAICLGLAILTLVSAWAAASETDKDRESKERRSTARDLELDLRRTIAGLRQPDADPRSIEPAPIWGRPHETERDRRNLETNLRWIIARLRRTDAHKPAVIGVFADAGVWHLGAARSIVEALENRAVRCRVLDRSCLTNELLEPFEAIVMPGGWSVFQRAAAGKSGLNAIRGFVESGGIYLGVCAGAYLAAKDVHWEGGTYPYPLGLFDGIAEGSLPEVAAWPKASGVRVKVTAAGHHRGIGSAGEGDFHYKGGPRFVGGTHVTVSCRICGWQLRDHHETFRQGRGCPHGCSFRTTGPSGWGRHRPRAPGSWQVAHPVAVRAA